VVQRPGTGRARGRFPETRPQPDKGEIGLGAHLNLASAPEWLVKWYKAQAADVEMQALTPKQIIDYETFGD
jgi:hypothetical protein